MKNMPQVGDKVLLVQIGREIYALPKGAMPEELDNISVWQLGDGRLVTTGKSVPLEGDGAIIYPKQFANNSGTNEVIAITGGSNCSKDVWIRYYGSDNEIMFCKTYHLTQTMNVNLSPWFHEPEHLLYHGADDFPGEKLLFSFEFPFNIKELDLKWIGLHGDDLKVKIKDLEGNIIAEKSFGDYRDPPGFINEFNEVHEYFNDLNLESGMIIEWYITPVFYLEDPYTGITNELWWSSGAWQFRGDENHKDGAMVIWIKTDICTAKEYEFTEEDPF